MSTPVAFIILIAVVAVVILVVGFIGNRIVDGAGNAMRAARNRQRRADPQSRQSESLAARYAGAKPEQTVTPQQAPAPRAKFCVKCGRQLSDGEDVCAACGHKIDG
ncbi:MAG: zinc-ribbon domain-containing protein [Clostridia bacterium]|nr:zinc-ribbon domain-containing protein [Clostridia bacterium]